MGVVQTTLLLVCKAEIAARSASILSLNGLGRSFRKCDTSPLKGDASSIDSSDEPSDTGSFNKCFLTLFTN